MRSSVIFLVLVVIMRCLGQWLPPAPRANDVCTDHAHADDCESLRIRGHCGEVQKFCRRTCGLCLPSRRKHMAQEDILPHFGMIPEDVMDEMTFDSQHLDIFSGQHMEEGDILLPDVVTLEDVLGGITSGPQSRTILMKAVLWPDGPDGWPLVPYRYYLKDSWTNDFIQEAIDHYELNTCIKFKEVPDNFFGPHIVFMQFGGNCFSRGVGRQDANNGSIVAAGHICGLAKTIHEIGHALGFPHEQSRSDRNKFIRVIKKNIPLTGVASIKQFKRRNTYNSVPYDLTSIMHYGLYLPSINGGRNMATVNPYDLRHISTFNSKLLSFRDIKSTNIGYKCIDKWKAQFPNSPTCENEGFIGSEGKCICHSGTQGDRCQHKLRPDYYPELTCGGNVTEPMILQNSPPGPPPGTPGTSHLDVTRSERCMWWIQAQVCHKVQLTVLEFKLEYPCKKEENFFEIRINDPIQLPGERICADLPKGSKYFSKKQDMFIDFEGRPFFSTFKLQVDFVIDPFCMCKKTPGGVSKMTGRQACQFRNLQVCAEHSKIFDVRGDTADPATICPIKTKFLACIETQHNRQPCSSAYTVSGDMVFLCNSIQDFVNGATGKSC